MGLGRRSADDPKFRKRVDNAGDKNARTLLQYQGTIPGRSDAVIYQFSTVRIVLPCHLPTLPKKSDTHQFLCVYRTQTNEFKTLFAFRFDCRISDRDPDWIAHRIAIFFAALLYDSPRSPLGLRAIVVCQESLGFWRDAFKHRVISLVEEIEKEDKERSWF